MLEVGDIVTVSRELAADLRRGWGGTPRILRHFLRPLKIKSLTMQDAEFSYPKWHGGGTFYLPQSKLRTKRKAAK